LLSEGGDFRSAECIDILKGADIVVSNPPFSLFREYVAQLARHEKKFLIIGNQNAITYKEVFPLIKNNKVWLGTDNGGKKWFQVRKDYDIKTESRKKIVNGVKYFSMGSIVWFTNLDHGRRHQELNLMTTAENLKFSKNMRGKAGYDRYENYDAIEVGNYKDIPSDYDGVMGVPITFLDKYNPDQFQIVGTTESNAPSNPFRTRVYTSTECRDAYQSLFGKPGVYDLNASGVVNGVKVFKRILIRHRHLPRK
jgi:Adenine-specific methyltransferase EcoRI